MTVKIGINGLGRIGRCVVRAIADNYKDDVQIVAVNGRAPVETHVHLLKYDSVHGVFDKVKQVGEDQIDVGLDKNIKLTRHSDINDINWNELGVDVVFECTGVFKSHEKASIHLKNGAKKVLISSPAPDPDATIVYGVNNNALKADDKIISVGSCTTNCLAPIAKVLNDNLGIESGFMTTIHAYTNDQNIADATHKDLRRARAGALSMIPTSTGAAKALSLVIPELKGKLDGTAIRVPTPNVSMVDLTFTSGKKTSVEQINLLMKGASEGEMKGVLGYCDEPLVSIDFNQNPHSSVFDVSGTKVVGDNFCRVASWYDNEWAFSLRMIDIAQMVS